MIHKTTYNRFNFIDRNEPFTVETIWFCCILDAVVIAGYFGAEGVADVAIGAGVAEGAGAAVGLTEGGSSCNCYSRGSGNNSSS